MAFRRRRIAEIRGLIATDAAALVACFRRCYGDTYPADDFYDAQRLARRIESGALRSVVAIADDGTLVGHTGLTVRHPGAKSIEAGNTVVDPACRGQGLLGQLATALTALCVEAGYIAYLHYPTTAHEIMQKASVRGGGLETGVMLDYIPAETDYRAIDRTHGRLAATVVYQSFSDAPARKLWIPSAYQRLATNLYATASLARTLRIADDPIEARNTAASNSYSTRRGLLHLHVTAAGRDLEDVVAAAASRDAPAVVHIDLCLDDPAIGAATLTLRQAGFVFCALLPEFAHTDVLRLQRLTTPGASSFSPRLVNAGAQRLVDLMCTERA